MAPKKKEKNLKRSNIIRHIHFIIHIHIPERRFLFNVEQLSREGHTYDNVTEYDIVDTELIGFYEKRLE